MPALEPGSRPTIDPSDRPRAEAATATVRVDPGSVGLSADRLERLSQVLRRHVEAGRLPGAVGLVARRGRVAWSESMGVQDPATGVPMRPDAIFRIFSMTKPIVSVAAMMLVEDGALMLTDPVEKWIPAFAGQQVAVERGGQVELRPAARAATVQDLLRHTAGLTYEFLGTGPVHRMYTEARLGSRGRLLADEIDLLGRLPLLLSPGERWEYSRATDVLGRVVEVVAGMSLGDVLQARILGPLGMVDTGFSMPESSFHRIAEPFVLDPDSGDKVALFDPRKAPALHSGGGGLMSTASDYLRFLQMLANGGSLDGVRLLGRKTVEHMTADHLGTIPTTSDLLPPGNGFGLGFAVRASAGVGAMPGSAGLYYWGGIAGTTFWVDPAEELIALLMIQAPAQRDVYRTLFRQMVYAAVEH